MIWGRAIFIKDVASKGQWETHIGEGERVHIIGTGVGGAAGREAGGWGRMEEEKRDRISLKTL